MSISIYYTAGRAQKLTERERDAMIAVTRKYSASDQIEEIEECLRSHGGMNWEKGLYFYDDDLSPDSILEGSTKLPDITEEAIWLSLQHWCKALSELRRAIPDADWRVHVDDHDIEWDADRQEYDPTI